MKCLVISCMLTLSVTSAIAGEADRTDRYDLTNKFRQNASCTYLFKEDGFWKIQNLCEKEISAYMFVNNEQKTDFDTVAELNDMAGFTVVNTGIPESESATAISCATSQVLMAQDDQPVTYVCGSN